MFGIQLEDCELLNKQLTELPIYFATSLPQKGGKEKLKVSGNSCWNGMMPFRWWMPRQLLSFLTQVPVHSMIPCASQSVVCVHVRLLKKEEWEAGSG